MSTLFAAVMAGGSGTRFWPASRAAHPKQLLPIGSEHPLLVETCERLRPLIPPERQLIVTGARYVEAVREMLPEVPPLQIVGEPAGRDTAACIGLAARIVAQIDPAATVVAMPADHVVPDGSAFREHLAAAEQALAEHRDALLVFGVEPDRPATGYGYLRRGPEIGTYDGKLVYGLDAFVEKPNRAEAASMLERGGHFWNAGLFAFRPDALSAAYASHLPDMGSSLDRIARAWGREEFEQILKADFPGLQRISIDFGVMEKVSGALLMPLPIRWDDVGSWEALTRLREPDVDGNVGQGDTLALDAHRNVLSANKGLVVVRGVDDLIVVHTPDATLVCRRDDEQGVRAVVEALREAGLQQYL